MENELPNNIEVEQMLLGSLINTPDHLTQMAFLPDAEDFFLERNRLLFKVIADLFDEGKPIDVLSIKAVLQSSKSLEKAGGASYIAELVDKGMLSDNIDYYSKIIIEKSQRRQLIKNAYRMLDNASDESSEIDTLLETSEQDMFSITDKTQSVTYVPFRHFYDEFATFINTKRKPGEFMGIASGFAQLDEYLAGFQKGEFIIIGARPSVGKTAFALNLVNNITINNQVASGFFSLEMSGRDIISRVVTMRSDIDSNKIRTNTLSMDDRARIAKNMGSILDAPSYISEISSMTLFDLRVQARRLVKKEKVEIIFIDYLGLLRYVSPNSEQRMHLPKHEQFSEISRSLKALARELNIPIIALSQLNREARDGVETEPTLANIRESGSIEQDADVVIFLHRKDKDLQSTKRSLIIAKQRNGPTGKINFEFLQQRMQFREFAGNFSDSVE